MRSLCSDRKIKKGVKFLGRMIGKKKDFADIVEDAVSERAEERPEGAEASVFCSLHDNSSYNPRHAQPPAYIKVRSSGKKEKDFNRMFLAQELQGRYSSVPGAQSSCVQFESTEEAEEEAKGR